MDNSINNIGHNSSLLGGFQRVFDQPASSRADKPAGRQDQIDSGLELSDKQDKRKTVDVRFYASSGSVSTVNPGDKGNHFDINI